MQLNSAFIASFVLQVILCGSIPPPPITERKELRKCCRDSEYMNVDTCRTLNVNQSVWRPVFTDSVTTEQLSYQITVGFPDCRSSEPRLAFHYDGSCDKLELLSDGKLKHYLLENIAGSDICDDKITEETLVQEYNISSYCLDKAIYEDNGKLVVGQVAMLCIPKSRFLWEDPNVFVRRVINPLFHGLAIVSFLIVGVVYFVLPQLRDLVGNIITTLVVCLIFEQISDIISIFDEYHSAMSYLVSDSIRYISSLGAFFWLNSFGFYVWKTFRSRNVFLRISDGQKYCYYSTYAWGSTFSMAAVALFAHLVLDTNSIRREPKSTSKAVIAELGIAVFLTTIVSTVLANVFFCLSTLQVINRMSTYGRIHHKLKYSYQLFVKLFIIITANWFFFILSWFPLTSFFYLYVVANLVQAIAILYVTVFNLKKVRVLLRKACCHKKCVLTCCRPNEDTQVPEWGEEMMAMNRNPY